MNKLSYLFSFMMIFILNATTNHAKAQTVKDIFTDATPITYLGIDFSNSKFYGDPGTVDGNEMVDLLKKINDVIVFEYAKKYRKVLIQTGCAAFLYNIFALTLAGLGKFSPLVTLQASQVYLLCVKNHLISREIIHHILMRIPPQVKGLLGIRD